MPSLAETGPIKGSRQDVVNVQFISYIIIHVHLIFFINSQLFCISLKFHLNGEKNSKDNFFGLIPIRFKMKFIQNFPVYMNI